MHLGSQRQAHAQGRGAQGRTPLHTDARYPCSPYRRMEYPDQRQPKHTNPPSLACDTRHMQGTQMHNVVQLNHRHTRLGLSTDALSKRLG